MEHLFFVFESQAELLRIQRATAGVRKTKDQRQLEILPFVKRSVYKALLFLGAGAVIHAVSDNQDFRKYGGLRVFLPLSYSVMLIASLSLVAFPAELFGKLLNVG